MEHADETEHEPKFTTERVFQIGMANNDDGPNEDEWDYEEILEKIGFGKTQWILLLISGLLTITSLGTQSAISIISIASQCEFELNQAEKGFMISVCIIGVFISTYFWGYACDIFGRKPVLMYSMFGACLSQFITMFVTNIWVFNVLNFIMGICLGGGSAAIYAYLSEFNTNKYRPIVINYSTMFVSVAAIYVPAIAWLVLSASWSWEVFDGFTFRPWRLILLLNLLPGLIGALWLIPFPESPKLLLAKNQHQQAVDAVNFISRYNKQCTLAEILNINRGIKLKPEILANDDILSGNRRGCGLIISIYKATIPLFHKPHHVNFIISVFVVFGMFFSSNGMQFWFPEIVNRSSGENAGNGSSTVCEILDVSFAKQAMMDTVQNDNIICDDSISSKTYIDNIIVGCAFLIGFSIQGFLLNPLGRKNVLMGAIAIAALSGILLHFIANKTFVLILFCLYILMPGLSISIMLGAVVDFMPTHLRGKAVSVCLTLGRLGIIVATNLMGVMLEPLCNTTFAMFTCTLLICFILVHFLPFK